MTNLKFIAVLAAIATLALSPAHALTATQKGAIKASVANVPALELPAKAAQVVAQASKEDKQDTAIALVREIVSKNQSLAPSLVKALVTALPDSAAIIAATAADLAVDQTVAIAKAAADAAPAQAPAIATVLAKIAPKSVDKIAAAAQVVRVSNSTTERDIAGDGVFFTFTNGRLDGGFTGLPPIDVGPYGTIGSGTR